MSFASQQGEQVEPDELRPTHELTDELDRWIGDPQELDDFGTIMRAVTGQCRELDGLDIEDRCRITERVLDWAEAAGVRDR